MHFFDVVQDDGQVLTALEAVLDSAGVGEGRFLHRDVLLEGFDFRSEDVGGVDGFCVTVLDPA